MAPAGPPSDPPDRPEDPRRREIADWDWGDDWDAPGRDARDGDPERPIAGPVEDPEAPRRGGRGSGEPTSGTGARAGNGASGTGRAASDGPRTTGADGRPSRTPVGSHVVRRRRLTAGAGVVAAVVVLGVVATALAGGGGHHAAPRTDGSGLAHQTSLAARATSDLVERSAAVARYAKIGRPVYCGAGDKPWVALTFDDGPGTLSPGFISLLAKEHVPATMFRIGRNVPGNERYVQVQRNLGWDSGSHTQTHPFLAQLTPKQQRAEIEEGNAASRKALGRPPQLFRPPYESHDAATDKIIEGLGMVEILWNVDTQDSLGDTSTDQIVETAKKGMQPGSIILMHEVKPNTLAALPRIIQALRQKGLQPVTITRMLASDGPSEAQLKKGYDGCAVDLTPGRAAS